MRSFKFCKVVIYRTLKTETISHNTQAYNKLLHINSDKFKELTVQSHLPD